MNNLHRVEILKGKMTALLSRLTKTELRRKKLEKLIPVNDDEDLMLIN